MEVIISHRDTHITTLPFARKGAPFGNHEFKSGARMDKTIDLFGDPRVNEVMSATRINEYCKRDIFEETPNPHGLWGGDFG